jgi:hypothetical protein
MTSLYQTIEQHLPIAKQRKSYGYNICCPVCTTLGGQKKPDKRFRCGIKHQAGSLRIHCFNCGFVTGYEPGSRLGTKLKQFMSALGISDQEIKFLNLKTLLPQTSIFNQEKQSNKIFKLPEDSVSIFNCIQNEVLESEKVVESWLNRIPDWDNTKLYWSKTYPDLLIIPIIKDMDTVGWIGRTVLNKTPKYFANYEDKNLFNQDILKSPIKTIFVTEGVFDAMSINGVAIMGNQMNENQIEQLKNSNKRIIIVPDAEKSGIPLCEQALKYNFGISYPGLNPKQNCYWEDNIKDANQAATTMGRIYTVYSLLQHATMNKVTIKNIIKYLEKKDG